MDCTHTETRPPPAATRQRARPRSRKQTEVRAIQFPQPVTPGGPAIRSNKSLAKRPSAELSGVVTQPQLFLSWPHLGSDASN